MLTVPEAARKVGLSAETIRRWIRAGKLASTKVGTQHVVDLKDVRALARPARAGEQAPRYVVAFDEAPVSENLRQRVVSNPDILAGKPAIRGTRISVELILDWLAAGNSVEEMLDNYPSLESDDIRAAFAYAAERVRGETFVSW